MPKPLSIDLRERIVRAVEGGGSVRGVGARFGVSPSSVSNLSRLWRETGSVMPRPMGGDRRSHATEGQRDWLLDLIAETPDLTLEEVRMALRGRGLEAAHGSIWRFFDRHGISFKKNRARRRAGAARRRQGPDGVEGGPGTA